MAHYQCPGFGAFCLQVGVQSGSPGFAGSITRKIRLAGDQAGYGNACVLCIKFFTVW
jgi:hypothetical protein